MVGMNRWRTITKPLLTLSIVMVLMASWGCASNTTEPLRRSRTADATQAVKLAGKIAEASPPIALQTLQQALESNQPQVTILSPRKNEVLPETTVSVRFQVKDLPIFKDEALGLGPHLHVLVDNRPYQAVYDLSQPLVLHDLEPGTHTIRAFASRPWHESFKNDGAFVQTTFHVLTKTQDNSPDPDLPLLTYSRPQGTYGAEPILLDFYLTNAPLHLVAQADAKDDIADWRIRCTVNGDSFILDRWQPIYLKGFKPGKNWVQLEYIDDKGNPVKNVFNNTVRLVDYQPNGQDTLSQLVRGELSADDVRGIVDPNYVPPIAQPEPTPTVELTPEPAPSSLESPPIPEVEPATQPSPIVPLPTPTPSTEPASERTPEALSPSLQPSPNPFEAPSPESTSPKSNITSPSSESEAPITSKPSTNAATPDAQEPAQDAGKAPSKLKSPSWRERLQQYQKRLSKAKQSITPVPRPLPTDVPDTLESAPAIEPESVSIPVPSETESTEATSPPAPAEPELKMATPDANSVVQPRKASGKSKFGDRFRRPVSRPPVPTPDLPPTLPEIIDAPPP